MRGGGSCAHPISIQLYTGAQINYVEWRSKNPGEKEKEVAIIAVSANRRGGGGARLFEGGSIEHSGKLPIISLIFLMPNSKGKIRTFKKN